MSYEKLLKHLIWVQNHYFLFTTGENNLLKNSTSRFSKFLKSNLEVKKEELKKRGEKKCEY